MLDRLSDNLTVYVYICVLTLVALYGFHRYVLLYLYVKHRHKGYKPKGQFVELPKVTVQLPMYNEDVVAERIIEASCRIDYPLEKLEIQVLDDSTDHSADIARLACEKWAAKGFPVKYVHRTNRVGYKAGALADGLPQATGEFIAIFDADFVPPRDILYNVLDYFTDEKVGMVQVRWDHLNRDASLLTNCQAIFLDGHFVIEHTARNRSGRFMHFNGTAGVWRRKTINDAGRLGARHADGRFGFELSGPDEGMAVCLFAAVLRPGGIAAGDDRVQAAGAPLDKGVVPDGDQAAAEGAAHRNICPGGSRPRRFSISRTRLFMC